MKDLGYCIMICIIFINKIINLLVKHSLGAAGGGGEREWCRRNRGGGECSLSLKIRIHYYY